MINIEKVKVKSKVLSIYYDAGATCGEDAQRFVDAGRYLMSLIVELEAKGYRVELWILHNYWTASQKGFCMIRMKEHRQPLNPLKISYEVLHPSFFRDMGLDG